MKVAEKKIYIFRKKQENVRALTFFFEGVRAPTFWTGV